MPENAHAEPIATQLIAHRARGLGYRLALDCPMVFARDVVHLLHEPDPAHATAMARSNPSPDNVRVLPWMLGDSDRSAVLHVAADEAESSMREPDAAFGNLWSEMAREGEAGGVHVPGLRYDSRWGTAGRATREQEINVRTLDGLLERGELPVRTPPDALSLDLPGTEYEALAGARSALRRVLAVTTGAAFIPRYRGQKLFGDIHAELREAGLVFAGFLDLHEAATRRTSVGFRGSEFPAAARCLFLRPAHALRQTGDTADVTHVRALKLAFVALTFGHVALALEAMDAAQAETPEPGLRAQLEARTYVSFLRKFHEISRTFPADLLCESLETAATARAKAAQARARRIATMGWLGRKMAGVSRRLGRTWIVLMGGMPAPYQGPPGDPDVPARTTPLEDLLFLYGFWTVAQRVRDRRARAHALVAR